MKRVSNFARTLGVFTAALFLVFLLNVTIFKTLSPFASLWVASILALIHHQVQSAKQLKKVTSFFNQMYHTNNSLLRFESQKDATRETALLTRAINRSLTQIQKQNDVIRNQLSEQEIIFGSMSEGVLVVNPEGQIQLINKAGFEILGMSAEEVRFRTLEEVIRIPDLQNFVWSSLRSTESKEIELTIYSHSARYIRIRSNPLIGKELQWLGNVFVLSDVTQLKKLESMRKEFVANVSHELRTPLTSIQGFAETLLSHRSDLPKEEADHYIKIIHRQAGRLSALVEDLLTLSRMEKEKGIAEIEFRWEELSPILDAAFDSLRVKCKERSIDVRIDCPAKLEVRANSQLLEQAFLNLLDNAIKYSPGGSQVLVRAFLSPKDLVIEVRDQGPGIAPEHLTRVFERFYRVDKGRDRKIGGTGLGLSIVKHVALVHRGSVEADSKVGEGSQFRILIPRSAVRLPTHPNENLTSSLL